MIRKKSKSGTITHLGNQLGEPDLVRVLLVWKLSKRDLSVGSYAGWAGCCYVSCNELEDKEVK